MYAVLTVEGTRGDRVMRGTIEFMYEGELDERLQPGARGRTRGGFEDADFTVTAVEKLTDQEYMELVAERGEAEPI